MQFTDLIQLHPADNVVVAVRALRRGERLALETRTIDVAEDVPMGHKLAVEQVVAGAPIRKYGQPIGKADSDIHPGQWVHSHNMSLGELDCDPAPASEIPAPPAPIHDRTFQGYRRPDGRAGTRNYLAIISTVNCSASVSKYVAERFDAAALAAYPEVDGVLALTHHNGCALPFGGQTHEMLNRVMGGMARHPNVGGYLLIGLGCEQVSPGFLIEQQQLVQIGGTDDDDDVPVFTIQHQGGTRQTIEAAAAQVARMLPRVNDVRREPIPASEIVLATECGGSDGYSGITANPAVGVAADLLIAAGGTAILSETTEIYGAEHLLTRRARSPAVAQKLLDRIAWWKHYTNFFGAELDNNPSTGNKAGGLTTIAEKSLGAVAKAGSTALEDVLLYAEQVTRRGLLVMDTPGFDPPSVTGMVAGGANMVVFTTGRGSCFGCKPAPSIKIATNTPMFERMEEDMDINAGTILSGCPVPQVGGEIFDTILEVASGRRTKSEQLGIGDEEFVPWIIGPIL